MPLLYCIHVHPFSVFHSLIFHLCVFQFRGSEILELANFKNATIEDIANVHEKAYVLGLEKVIYFPHVILLLSIYLLTIKNVSLNLSDHLQTHS